MISEQQVEASLNILQKDSANISANYLIACYLYLNNKLEQAYPFICKVIEKEPNYKGAKLILGRYYWDHEKKYLKAIQLFREELAKYPDSLPTIANLGKALAAIGEIEEAIELHKRYLELAPNDKLALDTLLMHSHYSPLVSNEELLEIAKQYSERISKGKEATNDYSHLNLSPLKTRLKIGFVSGDFKKHSVLFFIHGLLAELDKYCEVHCYCNNEEDQMTELLKQEVKHWRDITKLGTQDAVELIKKDEIDILIDLSGNTAKNRLDIFALKPCPVQASWLGQAGPLGLPEIDYMLCTEDLVSPEEDKFYLEKPFRLPNVYSIFSPPVDEVEITEAPCLKNNYVTFACLNNSLKINQKTLSTWVEILKQVPNSKLFLKNKFFSDPDYKEKIEQFFSEKGINEERLILEEHDFKKLQYIKNYNRVDIALDSFPVSGGTTSHDLLWMGVPLIACHGARMSQRISAAMLKTLDLNELVAKDYDEYVKKAVELAKDFNRIKEYKETIRSRYLNSGICNRAKFAKEFATALSQIWTEKIAGIK